MRQLWKLEIKQAGGEGQTQPHLDGSQENCAVELHTQLLGKEGESTHMTGTQLKPWALGL